MDKVNPELLAVIFKFYPESTTVSHSQHVVINENTTIKELKTMARDLNAKFKTKFFMDVFFQVAVCEDEDGD